MKWDAQDELAHIADSIRSGELTMAVQGHVSVEAAESAEPVIGVEFEPEHNRAVAFIDEGAGTTEIALSYDDLWHLRHQIGQVISEWEWHDAQWVSASEDLSSSTSHIMKKGEHDRMGKTLCGKGPSAFAKIIGGWKLAPIRKEPSRTKLTKYVAGTCQRCLAKYDRLVAEQKGE